jgi:hypothetical protein
MKKMIALFSVLVGTQALACNQQEAQFIGKVASIQKNTQGCVAFLNPQEMKMFNPSYICPLDQEEVFAAGVEVGLKNGHDCIYEPGNEISGVLVRINGGKIILE